MIEKGVTPLWGINGGKEGLRNNLLIRRKDQAEFKVLKTSGIALDEDDKITGVAGGGCGYGNPFERNPEAVREDVINGYVSVESARQDYGVIIDPQLFEIDDRATRKLRDN